VSSKTKNARQRFSFSLRASLPLVLPQMFLCVSLRAPAPFKSRLRFHVNTASDGMKTKKTTLLNPKWFFVIFLNASALRLIRLGFSKVN